ncbi:MAG TPA: SRPBCC domain-containing protein, partial [Thermoanaerobaculia bacterium]
MTKKIEREIEIAATPEEVWKAISDGEELKRWFPLDARVRPGVCGSVWLSWGEGSEWESPIEIWEPNRRLGTVDTIPGEGGAAPARIAVDYVIEARGGTTIVRAVTSGFP